MFKYNVYLYNKEIKIKPFTTETEKDLLLMSSFENYNIDEILSVLGVKKKIIKELSENEKKVLLYKFREISIGSDLQIKYKCKHCSHPNETPVECVDFIIEPELNDEDILKIDKPITDENMHEFCKNLTLEEILELDIDEYESLKERIQKNQVHYNFVKSCKCIACRKENYFSIGDIKYIIESLSEDTLMSLYKTYNDLIFYGKYNKKDIDSFYPFERSIFIGLLNKTREEIKK